MTTPDTPRPDIPRPGHQNDTWLDRLFDVETLPAPTGQLRRAAARATELAVPEQLARWMSSYLDTAADWMDETTSTVRIEGVAVTEHRADDCDLNLMRDGVRVPDRPNRFRCVCFDDALNLAELILQAPDQDTATRATDPGDPQ